MKILHVVSSTNPALGGVIEVIRLTCESLLQRGHQTEIVSVDEPSAEWLAGSRLTIHALGSSRTSYGYAPKLLPWLRENASRYDAVISHGLWQYPSFAVWQALHGSKTPYFVYTHGMLDPWFKQTYPLKHLKKCLYWPWAEYRVLRDAEAVLFTCEQERLLARQSFRRYQVNERVVNLGTSLPTGDPSAQREAFFARFPALCGKRLLLFLSRIQAKKGCDLLIEAFSQVAATDPALHLVMAGPDQTGWQAELVRFAAARGVGERITWPGMLAGDLKWGAFHAAEAFVLPSHQENFGIAVAEALACGLPVLISNKVNIWREIGEDGAGLVADDTATGTRQMLEQWLALPDAAQQAMRENAFACFERRFEISQAVSHLLAALGQAVDGPKTPAD